ncbi:hypothetical protein O181_015901 [Austropuccinia psidii MF-1]|uniref:FAD-binding PCMH-type domain-containing protein n=1 Tax=Austropuccinia psidii MF-1 TaxID=1389203 RepID=A0A9Q3GQJ1_9BASI|nr:hypothetical protein [Austropuccinia psidii MF-1]
MRLCINPLLISEMSSGQKRVGCLKELLEKTFIVFFLIASSWKAECTRHSPLYDCLCGKLKPSKIVFPGDSTFPLATLTYNLAIKHNATGIVYPSAPDDVAEAVKCASRFGVPLVARSGGHSYASFSSSSGSLIIDVTNFKEFSFSSNHVGEVDEAVKIGAGLRFVDGFLFCPFFARNTQTSLHTTRLGDLELALQPHERALAHGGCPYIGVSGHASCGGFGVGSRMWGLFLDQVLQLEVVTANGTILTTSEKAYPDLFFAMRGAGSSFGIITSLTLRTHAAPRKVIQFEISYRLQDPKTTAAVLHHFQSWALHLAPPRLSIGWSVDLTPQPQYHYSRKRELVWRLRGSYFGNSGRLKRMLKELTDGFNISPEEETTQHFNWLKSVEARARHATLSSSGINPSNNNATYYAKSHIIRECDLLRYEDWLEFTIKIYSIIFTGRFSPKFSGFLELDLIGGSYEGQPTGVKHFSSSTSSFGPRDALLLFQIGGYGPNDTDKSHLEGMMALKKWAQLLYENVGGGQKEMTGYNCYIDSEFSAERAHREYFGAVKTEKLKEMKLDWDPKGLFHNPHTFSI